MTPPRSAVVAPTESAAVSFACMFPEPYITPESKLGLFALSAAGAVELGTTSHPAATTPIPTLIRSACGNLMG